MNRYIIRRLINNKGMALKFHLFAMCLFASVLPAEDAVLWRCEEKMITVTRVHVPSTESNDSMELKYAFTDCYLKRQPIDLEPKIREDLIAYLHKAWQDAPEDDNEEEKPQEETASNNPVGLGVPANLILLQDKDNLMYLLRLTPHSAKLEKVNRPLEGVDLYFSDHRTSGVALSIPQHYYKILVPN